MEQVNEVSWFTHNGSAEPKPNPYGWNVNIEVGDGAYRTNVPAKEVLWENVTRWQFSRSEDADKAALDRIVESLSEPRPIGQGRLLKADIEHVEGYELLADVLVRAHDQASKGKGKERHARDATPFHEQPMATINQQIGSVDGFIYQAHKKSLEALRLPHGRNVAELLGAINYLAGAVIALETWAKKGEV